MLWNIFSDRVLWYRHKRAFCGVLILIVMEYLLWPHKTQFLWAILQCLNPYCYGISSLTVETWKQKIAKGEVLILIVMEYLLWRWRSMHGKVSPFSLNPYCYGISSLTGAWRLFVFSVCSLNPYCYGISSLTTSVNDFTGSSDFVLILIVMEYLLWQIEIVTGLLGKNLS